MYIQYNPKHLLVLNHLFFFYQPPLIQETNCQEIWYAIAHNTHPTPSVFFCWFVGPWFPQHQLQDWNPTNSGHPSRHPRSVPVVWRQIWRFSRKEATMLRKEFLFQVKGWIMPIGFGGYVGAISKKVLLTLTMMHFFGLPPTPQRKWSQSSQLHTGAPEKEASTTLKGRLMVGTLLSFQTTIPKPPSQNNNQLRASN